MNVLSLFDGMACGRIALDKVNVKVDTYFRSEIDPYATKVAESQWDDVVSLGDVRYVNAEMLGQSISCWKMCGCHRNAKTLYLRH